MAEFSIIDATTGVAKFSAPPQYNGAYCKSSYLEFREIASPTPINWKVGDYVDYSRTGLRYTLFDIPQPKKQSSRNEYGGSFVYTNIQFFAATKWLEIEPFRDLVPQDNLIHFSTRESWSVWTNVASLIERLQAVMDAARPNEWVFRLASPSAGSELYELLYNNYQDFTISGDSVMGGLEKIYNQWGNIGWIHLYENNKNVIVIGIPSVRTAGIGIDADEEYSYGKSKGIFSLKKIFANKDELRTRLFVYGSTRNMIPNYYNNLSPAIKDADSVDIQHLMLPLSNWGTTDGQKDASKAFIENNTALYGVRPASVYFNGGENGEIYPSIENTTIEQLYNAMSSGDVYRPDMSKWVGSDRIDEVVSASGINDDGRLSQDGDKYQYIESISVPSLSLPLGGGVTSVEASILYGETASHTGKLDFDISSLTLTLSDPSSTVRTFSMAIRVYVGTKIYEASVEWKKVGTSFVGSVDTISVNCNSGDIINVNIFGDISAVFDVGGVHTLSVAATTIFAQYAIQRSSTFTMRIPQVGFNISERASLGSEGIATIAMKDGMCGGRSFAVKSCAYNSASDAWDLTVWRGKDESLDMLFPNTTYDIDNGDHFVLLDIVMPETYITMASQKLLAAGMEMLNDISRIKQTYEPEINSKFIADNNAELREGWYMPLKDDDLFGIGVTEYVLIDTLTIAENESNIPTYRATLREQKRISYNKTSFASGYALASLASSSSATTPTVSPTSKGLVSVGLTMPTGFDVFNSPLTENGNINVNYAQGYGAFSNTDKEIIDLFEKDTTSVRGTTLIKAKYGLYSNGTISAGGLSLSSDRRLKDDINELSVDEAVEIIKNLAPSSWKWNDKSHISGKSYGFIAQDIKEILPDAVNSYGEYLTLQYTQFHAFEVKVLQKLLYENEILKSEIKKLKEKWQQ